MTLSTLQTMNLPMADLREALKARAPTAEAPAPTPAAATAAPAAAADAAGSAIDPMAWWGALTQQFTEIATNAVKDSAIDTARHMASNVVKAGMTAGVESAGKTLRNAAGLPEKTAGLTKKAARAAAPRRRKA